MNLYVTFGMLQILIICSFHQSLFAQQNPFGDPRSATDVNKYNIESLQAKLTQSSSEQLSLVPMGSKPGIISIAAMDTIILPDTGRYIFEIQVSVTDPDSIEDVDSVWFYSRKSSYPDYPLALSRMESGKWFIILQMTSKNRPDTYPFVFFADDHDGNLSDSLVHYVTLIAPLTSVKQQPGNYPDKFALLQNYPNPFNPTTHFGFRIMDFGLVIIKVYDVLGNEIETLVNEETLPGEYTIKFDAANLVSGTYFYQLRAKDFMETKKMILIK